MNTLPVSMPVTIPVLILLHNLEALSIYFKVSPTDLLNTNSGVTRYISFSNIWERRLSDNNVITHMLGVWWRNRKLVRNWTLFQ